MRFTIIWIVLCIGILSFFSISCGKRDFAGKSAKETGVKAQKAAMYHCPMHPTYISDKPGECPICGMNLVPIEEAEEHEKMGEGVPGHATVKIKLEKQQLIGVKKEPVSRRTLRKIIRTVGRVDYDETRLAYVNTKIAGWIEDLFIDFTGKPVEKGQPLLTIYSPQLVQVQKEYLLAMDTLDKVKDSYFKESVESAESLITAARERLRLWDITEEQVAGLKKDRKVRQFMTLYSPITGYVVEKSALKKKYVMPGENLYKIADLSTVWIYADIYEEEIPLIKEGDDVKVSLSYYPGEEFSGTVQYIYPYLEGMTRTVKVRIGCPNEDLRLKPMMFADVALEIELGEKLSVPAEAVLDTGVRQIVFLDKGNGVFEPRAVKLGMKAEKYYVVRSGIEEGDTVITSGNFLIDSESRLRAVIESATSEHRH